FLKLLLPNLPAAVMGIGNGDHIFVVIGDPSLETFNNDDHNLNLLPIDYRYLEKAAVVCDAWLGRVFPVSTLEENLKNYRCVPLITGVYINVITSFNPNYHYIKPVFTLPGTRQYDLPPAVNAYPIEEKENDNSDLVSFSANEANFWNSRRLEAATPPMNFNRMQEEEESFAQAYFSVNDANFWNTRSRASSSQIEEESSAAASFSINSAHRMLMDEG
ncbi:MAG TPA: hypothetical protein VLH77_05920, partial [Gammaproteobacteria bacterium]|nr:hypothetical protein [Gammaproteobacteria bacterium]